MDMPHLKELLNTLDKESLVDIICDAAQNDPEYAAELTLKLDKDESHTLDQCAARIRSAYTLCWDYYNLYDAGPIGDAMNDVADKARSCRGTNPLLAFKIFWLMVTEWVDKFDNIWDEDGELMSLAEGYIDEIRELADSGAFSAENSEEMFGIMLARFDTVNPRDDFAQTLASVLVDTAKERARKEVLEAIIARKAAEAEREGGRSAYGLSWLMMARFLLIQRFESAETASKFVAKNMDIYGFRTIAAEEAKAAKDWKRLLALARGGVKADGSRPQWQVFMLEAYMGLNDRENALETMECLAFNDNSFREYYARLKKQFDKAQWEEFFPGLCQRARKSRHWLDFIVEENMEPEIMEECRKQPQLVFSYYSHLDRQVYGEEIQSLFESFIAKSAASFKKRDEYVDLRHYLNVFRKACGDAPAERLRRSLIETYKKKRAFCEELSK